MTTPRSIDECPVLGCGALVIGIDAAQVFEGDTYTCEVGHHLYAGVSNGRAWLTYTGDKTT